MDSEGRGRKKKEERTFLMKSIGLISQNVIETEFRTCE